MQQKLGSVGIYCCPRIEVFRLLDKSCADKEMPMLYSQPSILHHQQYEHNNLFGPSFQVVDFFHSQQQSLVL